MCQVSGLEKHMCAEYARLKSTLPFSEISNTVNSAYTGQYQTKVQQTNRKTGKYGAIEEFLHQHYQVRFNVITNKPEILKKGYFQPLTDLIFNDIIRSASENHVPITEASLKVVLYSGFATRYNPYEEYFQNLPEWDGYDHIQDLVDKVPFRHPLRAYLYLTRWLTALVASALNDKVINQHMLVLVGAQGIGKTTFFNSLLPSILKPYIFHGVIRPEDKDTIALLADKLLVVVDELDTMRHYQLHQMKEVLTKPQVTLRRPYARTSENLTRRASFAASVNSTDFLVDPTGNRRFLCLFVDGVIAHELKVDIDQLFSQAYASFKDGEPYWFNQEEIADIEQANQDFIEPSAEDELLLQTFRPPHEDDDYKKLSATEIAIEIARKHEFPIGKLSPQTVGKMLVKNGFPSILVGGAKKYKVVQVRVK
jgi:predicted P-loop ATPase